MTPTTIALDFAADILAHPVSWQLPFVLARKLKAFGGRAEDHKETVRAFCEETGDNYLSFLTEFIFAWDRIRHPETGEDTLALAFELAIKDPVPLPAGVPEPPHPAYAVVYGACWHLAVYAWPDPFFLPRARVAELVGASEPKTVTRIVRWLERHALIECVDESYVFGQGKGKNRCKKYTMPTKRN